MARIKGATMSRKRRNKVMKMAKGYYGSKSSLFKTAKQAVMKSGQYAYVGRKQKKREERAFASLVLSLSFPLSLSLPSRASRRNTTILSIVTG